MPKSVLKKSYSNHILFYIVVIMILLLSAFNFNEYYDGQRVLGIEVQAKEESEEELKRREFWEDFLTKNPDYIPGWIELGEMEKVKQIDPNYFLGL